MLARGSLTSLRANRGVKGAGLGSSIKRIRMLVMCSLETGPWPSARVTASGGCQIFCAWADFSDINETLTEDDGELCLGLCPFTRRAFPSLGRMIEHQI